MATLGAMVLTVRLPPISHVVPVRTLSAMSAAVARILRSRL